MESRKERDQVLLDLANRIVVFGELTSDREQTLAEYEVDERINP